MTSIWKHLYRWSRWLVLAGAVLLPLGLHAASLEPSTVPVGVVGTYYQETLTAPSTMTLPITWSIMNGALPPGIALASDTGYTDRLLGTPTLAGTYSFRVRAMDVSSTSYELPYSFVVENSMLLGPDALPSTTVGVNYAAQLSVGGGTGPFHWSIVSGDLPQGLGINANTGRVSGVATVPGSYTFRAQVEDAYGVKASKSYSLTVVAAVTSPIITTWSLPVATVGASYSVGLTASGGVTPYTWSVVSGALPSGVTLSSDGVIRGTPNVAGSYTFTVRVRDQNARTGEQTLTLSIPTSSSELDVRLANFRRMGVSVHNLVKLQDDGNISTQNDSAVYYLGADGRRHAFTNAKVYFSWYTDFSNIRIVSSNDLASIPLGANVTYHPGVKMVKFMTDPKVYAVGGGRTLLWVKTESAAVSLYGSAWNRMVDDISDAFYTDYQISTANPIMSIADYNPASMRAGYTYPSDVMP